MLIQVLIMLSIFGASQELLAAEQKLPVAALKSAFCPLDSKNLPALLKKQKISALQDKVIPDFANNERAFGKCEAVIESNPFVLQFQYEKAIVPVEIPDWKDDVGMEIYVGLPRYRNVTLEQIRGQGKKLNMSLSYQVLGLENPLEEQAKTEKDISRSWHILLLQHLLEEFKTGTKKPADILPLSVSANKESLGILRDWRKGSLLTLDSLKNIMILHHDTMAAEELAKHLKRKILEKGSTAELCAAVLAFPEDPSLVERGVRSAFTPSLPKEIEKFYTFQSRDLGVAQSTTWFKKKGKWICVSVTANRPALPIEEDSFFDFVIWLQSYALENQ